MAVQIYFILYLISICRSNKENMTATAKSIVITATRHLPNQYHCCLCQPPWPMANDYATEDNNDRGGGASACCQSNERKQLLPPHPAKGCKHLNANNPQKNRAHLVHHLTPAPHPTTNTHEMLRSHPITCHMNKRYFKRPNPCKKPFKPTNTRT